MSKTMNWVMDCEEQAWSEVEEKIQTCTTIQEALKMAEEVFGGYNLLSGYMEVADFEDGVSEMFTERQD